MAGKSGNQEDGIISEINVTPLVDVVLVLLVIFMLTAPVLYQSAIKVQLPKAQTGTESTPSPLSFTITNDGAVSWGKEKMDWIPLEQKLRALKNIGNETAIITADDKTPHGTVIKLMDLLRQNGLNRFALSVEKPITSGQH